jgi:hypothetical protein
MIKDIESELIKKKVAANSKVFFDISYVAAP